MLQMSLTVAVADDPFIPLLPSHSRLPGDALLALPEVLPRPGIPHVVQGKQLGGFAKMVED